MKKDRNFVWFAVAGSVAATLVAAPLVPANAAQHDLRVSAHSTCSLPVFGPGASYTPHFRAGQHTARVNNPYLPFKPGRTQIYAGHNEGKEVVEVVVTSRRTKMVQGVRTRIIEDSLYLKGILRERTSDYYAQDRCGNVWYFGEDTALLNKHGNVVSRDGSFLAGKNGAQAGVFMQANPTVGRKFRQEWLPGQAQDTYSVVDLKAPIDVPAGSFPNALRTRETTALEPGVVDAKYYVRGIGPVLEYSVKGGNERLELIEVIN